MSYALRHENGTYFVGIDSFGHSFGRPRFGGTPDQAQRFPDKSACYEAMREGGWQMHNCIIVDMRTRRSNRKQKRLKKKASGHKQEGVTRPTATRGSMPNNTSKTRN